MKSKLKTLMITADQSVASAMRQMDKTADRILLLVDQNQILIRTITDGDLRRYLLDGKKLDDDLQALPAIESKVINAQHTPQQALALMNQHDIDHLPILDASRRVIGLLDRRDMHAPILLSSPHMSDFEREYVEQAFVSNWIAPLGPNLDAFEQEMAEYVDIKHAAALSSGTAALHLAMHILDVQADDVVFCSTLTFVASANPILYRGAKPVFIDSEPATWNMSPQALLKAFQDAEAKGKLPKAVMVVSLYGQSADMDPIIEICQHYQVPIIEDAAESLGATYKGKASGTLGVMGVYSFNGNKIITTSGGGMLVSNNEEYIKKARYLATQGRDPAPHYQHSEMAYNYRMSNVLAGIGRGQLKVLDDRVKARQDIYSRYVNGLAGLPINMMPEPSFGRCTHWLSALTIDATKTNKKPADLLAALSSVLIEGRPIWKPMHQQPLFANCAYYRHDDDRSISDEVFELGICLPSGSNLTEQQQERVIEVLRGIF